MENENMPTSPQQESVEATPTPSDVLAAAPTHAPDPTIQVPNQFLMWPDDMVFWGNRNHGDCVTAEEAFAKATADPQVFIPTNIVLDWATKHGYANGTTLQAVLNTMESNGFEYNGKTYNDGQHYKVSPIDGQNLQSAIYSHGPVKLGVSSKNFKTNTHGQVTGGESGWAMYGYPAGLQPNHCVSLCGYGNQADLVNLFKKRGVEVNIPEGMPTGMCYALFTWDSIGMLDEQSVLNMTYEAWVRNPVTVVKDTGS